MTADLPFVGAATTADKRVPSLYWVWLTGAVFSMLGTHVMGFALAWSATARSGAFAGLVLTMIVLPRAVLALAGGAVADRIGAWRVMIAGDALMIAITLTFAAAAWHFEEPTVLLPAVALAVGVVDAFYLPSSGSMPRLLVPGSAGLARAMSARQMANQFVAFVGAPLGGLIVAVAGLSVAALANAATFVLMLVILIVLRPRPAEADVRPTESGRMWQRCLDGLRVALCDPLLRPAFLLLVAVAAFLLPVSTLLVPFLSHERAWAPGAAGTIVGAIAVGGSLVAAIVILRGPLRRCGLTAMMGVLVAGLGAVLLALAPQPALAVAAGIMTGLGTGLFAAHIAPLILGGTPHSHLARVQAVVLVAQSLPLLVTNNGLGVLADATSASTVILVCAACLVGAALAALTSSTLRRSTSTWA